MAIKFNKLTTVLALASVVTSLLPVAASAAEVNVYSSRKEALIKPLLDQFSEKTGIEVNLLTGNSDALLARLKSEGEYTAADLFLTVDAPLMSSRPYRRQKLTPLYLNIFVPVTTIGSA